MNKSQLRTTSTGFKTSTFSPTPHKHTSSQQKLKPNPEDEIKTSNPNDPLIKILAFDNGNSVKDCKAILDAIRDEGFQQKDKLPLFYQEDCSQLIENLDVGHISLEGLYERHIRKEVAGKIRRLKMVKKGNQTYSNYSKLMKYALREDQKIRFMTETSKIVNYEQQEKDMEHHKYEHKHDFTDNGKNKPTKKGHHPNASTISSTSSHPTKTFINSSMSILDKIILQKRNNMAIQNSSKINKEQNDLQLIMKNRTVCQKILEEALMFERYYDILKKEKGKVLERGGKREGSGVGAVSGSKVVKTQGSLMGCHKSSAQQKSSHLPRPRTLTRRSKTSSSLTTRPTTSSLCINPKHLRLQQPSSPSHPKSVTHYPSEQDYHRTKYLTKLKRDEYLKQINRINEEFVEKRNLKNNVLIGRLLGFIRNNSAVHQEAENNSLKKRVDRVGKYNGSQNDEEEEIEAESNIRLTSSNRPQQKPHQKSIEITGSGLTKILRKLFLIYSFKQTDQTNSQYQSLICRENLLVFMKDFEISLEVVINGKKTDNIREILDKESVDEFQFIQFVHLLSTVQSVNYVDEESYDDLIYTNINKWVATKILNRKYEVFLSLQEQRTLKKILRKETQKLRKLNRFEDRISQVIEIFTEQENINKMLLPKLFDDFDYVLEALWFMKIYPTYVNKRTVRFYFEYLKDDKNALILNELGLVTKRKQFMLLENIVWLIIAKVSIEEERNGQVEGVNIYEKQMDSDAPKVTKSLEQIFTQKFKCILKLLLYIIEAKNQSKYRSQL